MPINSLVLNNYRSYETASFEFSSGVTIIIGPNASGKTNLLEAVYLICSGESFRVSDKDLIRYESKWLRVDIIYDQNERTLKIERAEPRVNKTFVLNGTDKKRLSHSETIPVVLFEPDDIRMIGGSPQRRRDYLDRLLCAVSPEYKKSLGAYKRALRQRNALLKTKTTAPEIFPWDVILSKHAEVVVVSRLEIISKINETLSQIYSKIADQGTEVSLQYQSSISGNNYASKLMSRLERLRDVDRDRGFTSVGPHRDDFVISINSKLAGLHASRGECRSITLALKIIEMNIIEQVRGQKPLLLLDDVFSELDGSRRRSLTEYLDTHQTIITTTDADVVGKKFTQQNHIISI